MITLKKVIKKYETKTVLDGIDLYIRKGEYISIIGESGAGKSTLMNIIGTLDTEFEGEYLFRQEVIKKKEYNKFRNTHIGFIFQQYNLISNITVFDNIMLPYIFHKNRLKHIAQRADELMEKFNINAQKYQIVNTLSGGEQQRIALIRSILLNPTILIADEPTGNLDKNNSRIIQDFLKEMKEQGKTIVVVTHDLEFAKESSRKYLLKNGKLYEYS